MAASTPEIERNSIGRRSSGTQAGGRETLAPASPRLGGPRPQRMDQLEALCRLAALERLPRTGWLIAGLGQAESVAAHGLGVALVVLALGPGVAPGLDVDRALALAIVHDAPEALLGDLPKRAGELLPAGAKAAAEARAAAELLGPLSGPALERFEEYRRQESREARFVRLCDKLALGVRLVAYRRSGARGLEGFLPGLEALDCSEFPSALALKDAILAAAGSEGAR
jgi:putative hydrolase of HD superfamily